MVSEHTEGHGGGTRLYVLVLTYLVVITALEVFLAYEQLFSINTMLGLLMALSLVKAGLIMAYFMHLRFERMNLILSLVPSVVIVITLLFVFFPDGYRALNLRAR
jgi:cytochrome c oxidase subunit 4